MRSHSVPASNRPGGPCNSRPSLQPAKATVTPFVTMGENEMITDCFNCCFLVGQGGTRTRLSECQSGPARVFWPTWALFECQRALPKNASCNNVTNEAAQ